MSDECRELIQGRWLIVKPGDIGSWYLVHDNAEDYWWIGRYRTVTEARQAVMESHQYEIHMRHLAEANPC
jgi:hypothetical protein